MDENKLGPEAEKYPPMTLEEMRETVDYAAEYDFYYREIEKREFRERLRAKAPNILALIRHPHSAASMPGS